MSKLQERVQELTATHYFNNMDKQIRIKALETMELDEITQEGFRIKYKTKTPLRTITLGCPTCVYGGICKKQPAQETIFHKLRKQHTDIPKEVQIQVRCRLYEKNNA